MYSPPWQTTRRKQRASFSRPDELAEDVRSHIEEARSAGCSSLRQIAFYLNANGLCTARGCEWGASQVRRTMLTMTNSAVRSNTSASSGGGIFVNTGTVNIQRTTISGNTMSARGAGIYTDG